MEAANVWEPAAPPEPSPHAEGLLQTPRVEPSGGPSAGSEGGDSPSADHGTAPADSHAETAAGAGAEDGDAGAADSDDIVAAAGGAPVPETGWRCDHPGCDCDTNLWLNLSDGFIGCGRMAFDGTGGRGHALAHFRDEKDAGRLKPLSVKLGAITDTDADVYDYELDCDVADPHLDEHLAFFGLDRASLQKTQPSIEELELELSARPANMIFIGDPEQ